MQTLIIDNEAVFRKSLRKLLDLFCPAVNILGEADGVASGYELTQSQEAQLVFLDINMDDGTGLDLLRKIPERKFEVIFTTAHDQYALDALKLSALDYLLKPIDPEELQSAVFKAKQRLTQYSTQQEVQHNFHFPSSHKKLVLKDAENFYLVDTQEIIRCEATGSYTQFFLTDHRKMVISNNLRTYEDLLGPFGFFRSHHSHLFSLHHLSHYEKGQGGQLIMKDGSRVPVSVRRKEQLLKMLSEL